jgi:dihydroorotate dehydrogenase (fumarate)
MKLDTTYLGLHLAHPLMAGASPLADTLDGVRRLEDAGASAIVLRSLFEEQVSAEEMAAHRHLDGVAESFAEATTMFPLTDVFGGRVDAYLEHLRRVREAVAVPVIASLNGTHVGPWIEYGRHMQEAGAHALELNLYTLPTDPSVEAAAVERGECALIEALCARVTIPVAVKLSPFYSSLPSFLADAEGAGARGAVLFNRFYQADIDIEALALTRELHLSDRSELLLRLRWLAITSPRTALSLACSGGVHMAEDVVKAVMSGAHAVQVVSALLKHGAAHLADLLEGFRHWGEAHEYGSVDELRGSMNLARCPDPAAYERANYLHLLQSWHG